MEYRSRATKMVEAALALTLMTDNSAAESKVIVDECQNNLNKITEKDPENLMVSSIKHNSIEVIESEVPQIEQQEMDLNEIKGVLPEEFTTAMESQNETHQEAEVLESNQSDFQQDQLHDLQLPGPSQIRKRQHSDSENHPFDSDDSVADPDFNNLGYSSSSSHSTSSSSSSTSSSDTENNTTPNSSNKRKVINPSQTKKIGKKRLRCPEKWHKNVAKTLRNQGKEYVSVSETKKVIHKKAIQPPCGDKCKLQCSKKISEEDRKLLFTEFWGLADLQRQRDFLASSMTLVQPKYQYKRENSHRQQNNAFYFFVNNQRIRVCKFFFKATLSINDRPIRTVAQKKVLAPTGQILECDKRGRHGKHKKVDETVKERIRTHIKSIPKIESHYTRSHTSKEFIEGGKTIADLHRDYDKDCQEAKIPSANYYMYAKIFNEEFNLSFFVPKKDQCDYCIAFEQLSEVEKTTQIEEYNKHHREKELSREEKKRDKNSEQHVAVYDLQATLPCPKGNTSNFYYVSKVNVFNFTVFNLKDKNVDCYVWHEGQALRGANEIGTCIFKYLKDLNNAAETKGADIDVVFYSDNCGGQQKNRFVMAMYLYAVSEFKNIRSITHKYLITGHSQNEGDSAHSVIERQINRNLKSGPIYIPEQYYSLIRTAKKTGNPFKVHEMCYSDFFDFKTAASDLGYNNFNRNTDGETFKLTEVKIFKVTKDNLETIFYKNSYNEEDYKKINIKCSPRNKSTLTNKKPFTLKRSYQRKPGVAEKKKTSLLSLFKNPKKSTVPNIYFDYYKNL